MKSPLLKIGHLLLLGLVLLAAGKAHAQLKRETLDKYDSLDLMLRRPLVNNIVTNHAYEAMLYKKQVALTGLAVPTGKTLGTSLSTDDKSVAASVGLFNIRPLGLVQAGSRLARYKHFSLTPILTFRSTSDKGFVAVFTNNHLQTITSFGGSLLLFGGGYSRFNERTKKDLHWKLNRLRAEDRKKWADSKMPYSQAKWEKERYRPLAGTVANFVLRWWGFQQWLGPGYESASRAHRYYEQNGNLTLAELRDDQGERLDSLYLMAEHAALPLLGADWDALNCPQESQLIREFAPSWPTASTIIAPDSATFNKQVKQLAASLLTNHYFIHKAEQLRLDSNQVILEKRLKLYDSLQQNVA